MGHRTNVIASLERGTKVKEDFKGWLLGVHQRCSRDAHVRLWVDTEHGTSLDAIEDHHRERINVWMLVWMLLNFWFDSMFMLDNVGV
jgi:hypothetical protein